jgi:hypothetical protein
MGRCVWHRERLFFGIQDFGGGKKIYRQIQYAAAGQLEGNGG